MVGPMVLLVSISVSTVIYCSIHLIFISLILYVYIVVLLLFAYIILVKTLLVKFINLKFKTPY